MTGSADVEPMGTLAILGITIVGAAALLASIAVRTADQCRRRVAHARIVAQARRIEDARRQQIMSRFSPTPMSVLPGLRDESDGR